MANRSRWVFEPAVLFSATIALLGVMQAWQYSDRGIGFDFYQFWVVGSELRAGNDSNIYTDNWRQSVGERYFALGNNPKSPMRQQAVAGQRRLLQTFSSPLLCTFFSVIGVSDFDGSFTLYRLMLIACGVVSILILCRLLDYTIATSLLVVGVLLGWCQPFLSDVFVGNVNQLQLLMVAGLLWVELRMRAGPKRDLAGGAILGLVALFKPNLAPVAILLGVMWLVDGQRIVLARHLAGAIVGSIVLMLLASWRFGSVHCWIDWLGALHQLGVEERTIAGANCSLVQMLREFAAPSIASVVGILILLAAIVFVGISRGRSRVFCAVGLGCVLPLLSAPIAWVHYFIFCTPLLLMMARRIEVDPAGSLNAIVRYVIAGVCLITLSIAPIFSTDDLQSTAIRMVFVAIVLLVFGFLQMLRSISDPRVAGEIARRPDAPTASKLAG